MTDSQKTETTEIKPLTVTIVGGGTGDGSPLQSGTVLQTPDHQPNVIVKIITPLLAILIREANVFLYAMSGFIAGGSTPAGNKLLGAPDFVHLCWIAAGFAVAPTGIAAIKDGITLLSGLEKKYPLLTGSV